MPVLNPDVTKLTGATNSLTDVFAQLFSHFSSPGGKFTVVANGGAADAFTLTPAAAGETWQVNLRRTSTELAQVAIDPLANITDPGDTVTPPTLTSDTEWSTETQAINVSGGQSVDFYVIEVDDCFIILFMDAAKTHTPFATSMGRFFVPYYTDGTDGNDFCDGLGILGYQPELTTSASGASSGWWLNASVSGVSLARGFQTFSATAGDQWFQPSTMGLLNANDRGDINGNKKVFPATPNVELLDTSLTVDYMCGYTKYMASQNTSEPPGTVLDGGPGNDAWIHVNDTAADYNLLLPWNRLVTPDF